MKPETNGTEPPTETTPTTATSTTATSTTTATVFRPAPKRVARVVEIRDLGAEMIERASWFGGRPRAGGKRPLAEDTQAPLIETAEVEKSRLLIRVKMQAIINALANEGLELKNENDLEEPEELTFEIDPDSGLVDIGLMIRQ